MNTSILQACMIEKGMSSGSEWYRTGMYTTHRCLHIQSDQSYNLVTIAGNYMSTSSLHGHAADQLVLFPTWIRAPAPNHPLPSSLTHLYT
jgi:hypothetical protein